MRKPKFLFIVVCILLAQAIRAQVITVKVSFSTKPSTANAEFADLKYNKQAVFNLEIDDQPANTMSLLAYLQGGKAPEDKVVYPGKFFSDGCGNKKPFTIAVAMTAHSNYNDGDLTEAPSFLNEKQLKILVKKGCLIQNHGFYHGRDQYYIRNNFDQKKNIAENAKFIYRKTGFVPRVWVTPSNDEGYNKFVEELGYLAATSQGVTDGYLSHPPNMWSDRLADVSSIKPDFNVFLRDFTDDWNKNEAELKSFILGLKNSSGNKIHKLYRLGTHGYNSQNWRSFKSFIDYVDSVSKDAIWVTTLQELLEYFEVKTRVIKKESLESNHLIITLDLSEVPKENYFKDMTLMVKANANISSVSVSGADSFSYNKATGLINIFKIKSKDYRPTGH